MEVVNGFYYFDVFLIETYKNLGQYDLITNNEIIGTLTTITFTQNTAQPNQQSVPFNINVSGITKSRLTEVRSFDPNVPYKAGINGVLFVTTEYVEYSIGDVIYKTFLDTQLTTFFKVTKPTNELQSQSIIGNDNSVSIDIKKTLNAMVIDRSNISIYEYFNKINNCNELDDLLEIF